MTLTTKNKIEYSVFPGVQVTLDKTDLPDYLMERSSRLHSLLVVLTQGGVDRWDEQTQASCLELAESMCAEVVQLAKHVPLEQQVKLAHNEERKESVSHLSQERDLTPALHPQVAEVLKQASRQL